MTATSLPSGLRRLTANSDVVLAVAVVFIVAMLIVPLPDVLLDLLIIVNIATALTILMVAMYITQPLQFSVFPSILLVATLFRLGLNVSATRLILLQGEAGRVIEAFGSFVVGGNYVVGAVVFIILIIVQFVVITRGAERVAEVAARFTLDAMPGKQMAIDADLNAGLITQDEARRRRREIEREADFYGAMDGASKFVKGDAIAAILIAIVNIVAGVIIGITQLGIPPLQALQRFALLTIGDGLVSQIPALIISTATGIVVTRAASDANLGTDVGAQLFSNPKALAIVAGLLGALALVPGLPTVSLATIALGLGGFAFLLNRSQRQQQALVAAQEAAALAAPPAPENPVALLAVDPMEVEIGYGLISLVDAGERGNLLDRITAIRRQTALELGFIVPTIRIRDNLQLGPNTYVVKLRGVEIARGELLANHYLAMNSGVASEEIEGIEAREPAFGLPALWITGSQRERAELLGYTVVDPASVLATHLTEVIRSHAADIFSRQDLQTLLTSLKNDYPAVVDDLIPGILSTSEVHRVLQNLLRERVSIRDLVTILETLAARGRQTRDTDLLTEYVRQALSRAICQQYREPDGQLYVLTLAPQLEQRLAAGLQGTDQGLVISIEPTLAQRLLQDLVAALERMVAQGHQPIVVCSPRIRLPFKRLTERVVPHLTVLAYSELNPKIEVNAVGIVGGDYDD
ncbi:MAG: flagellar biosynthesis protein FlhA [Chloroflexota bacterium]|nr:flagellar biosynthesis protein FlhA [Dehalococcoidia bacterium]MDW8254876.1 flagellar biosynthesis protein FlhA [Chloroflexota bacterium]